MERLKYALIGCGRIAPNHLHAAHGNRENLQIAAVCDLIPERMDQVLSTLPEGSHAARYTDYREMLEKEKPDLVAVATPSGDHAEIALAAIVSGAHVIIEKPIALSLPDVDKLEQAAGQKGVVVSPCHQNRFNASIQKIREAVEEGLLGRLYHAAAHIRWNREREYYAQAPWRGTWAQDGGALMNQCIHNIDLLRWMMGNEIDEVCAYTANLAHPYIEAEDLGLGMVRFKNGAYGLIEGTTNVYGGNLEETLYLFGEKGTIQAGGKSVNQIEIWNLRGQGALAEEIIENFSETPPNVYGFGHSKLYRDVIGAIQNRHAPSVTIQDGRRALELVLAMYRSAYLGRPVPFPLGSCAITDFMRAPSSG